MGLEQVIEEVRAEGQREADAIVEEAEQEAEAIVEEAREKASEEKEQRLKEARQEADAERRRILASAELDSKKQRLDAEADVLASIRSRVETRLAELPADERADMLRALVEDAGVDDWGEDARAWARAEDRGVVEDLGLTFEEGIDCLGGVVVESPDGSIREDLRFDTLLDEVWREKMHEVAMDVLDRNGG